MASVDKLEDNTTFAQKNNASFPILADPSKVMAEAYGVLSGGGLARRWTFYIDPQGIIRQIDKAVNPRNAGTALVANLKALNVPPTH
jgi:peroxiredoxin Q/BCP